MDVEPTDTVDQYMINSTEMLMLNSLAQLQISVILIRKYIVHIGKIDLAY